MSFGTVDQFYNNSTLVVSFSGQQKYVSIVNITDPNSQRLRSEDIKIGDFLWESGNSYIWQMPQMFDIQPLEAHYLYPNFNKSSLIEFSHFRVTQVGERSKCHAIGIALMEYILAKKDLSLIERLKTLDFQDSTIGNVIKYLEKKISAETNFNQSLNEISTKTLFIEDFAIDLLDGRSVEEIFRAMGITFCKWDSYLNYISSNELESYYRVNFLCLNENNWIILYTRDFYYNFISDRETQRFFNEISCDKQIFRAKTDLGTKLQDFEQLLLNQLEKIGNSNSADKVFQALKGYFSEFKSDNSALFFQALKNASCRKCKKILNNNQKAVLECTHVYCNKCFIDLLLRQTGNKIVLNDDEKGATGQVTCDCGFPIQEEVIKNNCKEYEIYKNEAESRKAYLCKFCHLRFPKNSFNTECQDSCDECSTEIINLMYDACQICKKIYTDKDLKALGAFKKKCDKCGSSHPKIQAFSFKICDHYYCHKCAPSMFNSKNEWNCPKGCAQKKIDHNQVFWYSRSNCTECNSEFLKSSEFYMYKNCICKLCSKCVIKDPKKCPKCETANSNYVMYLINEELELKKKQEKVCLICNENYESEKIIEFINCSHFICENCMIGNTNALLELNEITKIFNCFHEGCNNEIESSQLEYLLSPQKRNLLNEADDENSTWNKLIHRKIHMDTNLIDCPKCKFAFIPDVNRRVQCLNKQCGYMFCKICKEDYHQNQLSCQTEFILKRIRDMENAFPDQQVSQCPICKTPSLKDDKCNHVKCPDCKIDFCFVCSAIRSPILAHGNHYHRPQCTDFFEKGSDPDNMSAKCTECAKAGQLCERPKDLAVRGRFGEGEA